MKVLNTLLILLILIACSPETGKNKELLSTRISRIENGLQPNFQIQGDSIPNYKIEERMKELGIPGVSIAVINGGHIEWAKGYGVADSSENRLVTSETMFLAGSISKPVAAIRAHQLAEDGVINLDSNVNQYLSSWKLPENEFTEIEKVTTRRILNHTAGLTVWGFPGYDKGDTIPSVAEVLNGKGNTDSVHVYKEPGESWMYSGGGYTIMQLMISDLEKTPFPEIMQSNVLDPLGMTLSTFENPLPQKYQSIAATGYRASGEEVEGKWPIYPEMAAAGLWTTPSQLILWAKEVQKTQQTQENGLLKVETVNEMLTSGMNDHGLGPGVSEHTYGHGGADEGFRANLVVWKEHPVAVVVMVNSDNGSIIQEILLSIANEYLLPGIEPDLRKVANKSVVERTPMVGTYIFPELGVANVTIKENGLEIDGDFTDEPILLLPETDSTYFNTKSGTYYTFLLEGENVTGIKFWKYTGEKTE
ncbi:beta-lactamase family protein [Cryomorpha ignava]|uniref:Beta-lactamase family protein n=1 Tax=Cryomorpha ignava TaxID=101383 RepID=A0A7K3WL46_9FLAO|nr:serine hydrolase domain-containing protein [Cryomorpha ignava]NEN22367.1 beta-lactamase family protein [Cryomorpha ignava]